MAKAWNSIGVPLVVLGMQALAKAEAEAEAEGEGEGEGKGVEEW